MAKLTLQKIMTAAEKSMMGIEYSGFCTKCGTKHYGIEGDTRGDKCTKCGAMAVYGAEELAVMFI